MDGERSQTSDSASNTKLQRMFGTPHIKNYNQEGNQEQFTHASEVLTEIENADFYMEMENLDNAFGTPRIVHPKSYRELYWADNPDIFGVFLHQNQN